MASNDDRMIKKHVDVGADPFVENCQGVTPWDLSLLKGHACSIEFARCGMFEGLVYVKARTLSRTLVTDFVQNSKVQPSVRSSRAFWVRVVPRYARPDTFNEKQLTGVRMYIHWRMLDEPVCEIDLEGCKAEIVSDNEEDTCNLLLVTGLKY